MKNRTIGEAVEKPEGRVFTSEFGESIQSLYILERLTLSKGPAVDAEHSAFATLISLRPLKM